MTMALRSKNKLGFVDGTVEAPEDAKGLQQWEHCNFGKFLDPQFYRGWNSCKHIISRYCGRNVAGSEWIVSLKQMHQSSINSSKASQLWNKKMKLFLLYKDEGSIGWAQLAYDGEAMYAWTRENKHNATATRSCYGVSSRTPWAIFNHLQSNLVEGSIF